MMAMLRANMRAGEIRDAALGHAPSGNPILRGAPTHSCSHLLDALDEIGWQLVRKS